MALVEDAVSRIHDLIRSGALRPGQRLPPEGDLAAQLGMSRNPLREAVKVLAASRVLEVRRGDGTYVTALSPTLLFEGLGVGVELLHDRHLAEVLMVRRMLESTATGLAASRISQEQLAEVRGHLDAMRAATHDVEMLLTHDIAFHRSIAGVVENEFLLTILDGISRSTQRLRVLRGRRDAAALDQTLREHEAILTALELRDPELARSAAALHIATSEGWLRQAARDWPGFDGAASNDAAALRTPQSDDDAEAHGTGR